MSTGARAPVRALMSHYVALGWIVSALGVADEALDEAEEQEYPTGPPRSLCAC
jgi:hypothetical protein